MNDQYKKVEKIIKDIISNNVKTTDHNKRLKGRIYYRNCKVKNLIMKNNITHKNDKFSTSHAVYEVQCPRGDCMRAPQRLVYWTNSE